MKVKNKIQIILDQRGKTQKWLAETMNLTVQAVNKWCKNIYQPDEKHIVKLTNTLKTTKEEIFYLSER